MKKYLKVIGGGCLFALLLLTLLSWVLSYFLALGVRMPLDPHTNFEVALSYGIVTIGRYYDSGRDAAQGIEFGAVSIEEAERPVRTLRSVGINIPDLSERPSFDWKSDSFTHKGRHIASKSLSFPQWLLCILWGTPSLWILYARFIRSRNRKTEGADRAASTS